MPKNNIISIAGKQGAFENTRNALKQIDLSSIKGKSVLIKPNCARVVKPEHGYNTHPDAVSATIEAFQEAGASKISIGESPIVGIDTMQAFEMSGIKDVANKYGIDLIDFDKVKPIKKPIPNARVVKETKFSSVIFEYDIIVSLPVTKTHMHTGVTLGIKNFKGCLYRHEKVRYHQLDYLNEKHPEKALDSAISDLATILIPDITVVDGYIGMEGLGPSGGHKLKSNFALASWHPLGADIYACLLMGIDPASIPHLRLVAERRGYSMNPNDYSVVQTDWEEYIFPYQNPPKEISIEYKNVVFKDSESCSACLSTIMLFLRRFKSDMGQYLLDDGNFHLAIGKSVDDAAEGTVFVGNCTRKNKDRGIFVSGCPPVPTRIYEAITGEEPEENEPDVV
ncbi:MAG: DUF362 domain-containing protein [Salinivirgaceae bacterium]|jgi:uncharacterized protein (DUF362 family)|nr:DUF362 domain-containing protein [Salinivirgaceae bacterium]